MPSAGRGGNRKIFLQRNKALACYYGRLHTPVFIVGAPRSGTTVLKVVLNRHPELAVCGESRFFIKIYNRRAAFGDLASTENRARAVDAYLATPAPERLGIDRDLLRDRLMSEAVNCREFFAAMLRTFALQHGKPHAGEKTPYHAMYAKILSDWFPEATIIHLIRDPRDSVSSLMKMPWSVHSAAVCAYRWRTITAAGSSISDRANYLRLRYEDLAREPEAELRRVCDRIGIGWAPEMLEASAPAENTVWWYRRAHQPLNSARVGIWQSELAPWQVAVVERIAGQWMDEFGYERHEPRAGAAIMLRAAFDAFIETGFQKTFRLPAALSGLLAPTNLEREERWRAQACDFYARVRLRVPEKPPQRASG